MFSFFGLDKPFTLNYKSLFNPIPLYKYDFMKRLQ